MDDTGFDVLARWCGATPDTRRRIVRLIAGGGLGMLLGRDVAVVNAARGRSRKRRRREQADRRGVEREQTACRVARTRESGLSGKKCALRGRLGSPPVLPRLQLSLQTLKWDIQAGQRSEEGILLLP